MEKILHLILFTLLFTSCEQCSNCEQSKTYIHRYGTPHRELSQDNPIDSAYMSFVEYARIFVKDSLEEDIKCFQYNFDFDVHNDQLLVVVEFYDKRLEIAEKSPFNDSIDYRLNNLRNLYFDTTGIYLFNKRVSDTEAELKGDSIMFEKMFNEDAGS